ncbi:MAG: hypothetical protein WC050_00610 [Candidatus Paceibacterota bacterium]
MKTAVFLYEIEQLDLLDSLVADLSKRADSIIVSLDAEVDYALERRGVPFISGKTLQNRMEPSAYMRADEITALLCESEELSFLTHRAVSLVKPLRLVIHQYFQNLLYYTDVIGRFVEQTSDIERLVIPASSISVSKTSGPLAREEVRTVIEAAELVALARNIPCEVHGLPQVARMERNRWWRETVFGTKRFFFGITLFLFNGVLAARPRRRLCLIASDYWRNMTPVLNELSEETEIIMLDRSEALKAGFRNIWRHKMQFVHIAHFLTLAARLRSWKQARALAGQWAIVRADAWKESDFSFGMSDVRCTADRIMTRLIDEALHDVIRDIEGAYAMYERLAPDAVWLRASVSGQRHFAILPLVACEIGLPALEVQHGGEYLGRGSPTREHPAQYLAVYGKLVCDEFRALGYESERLIVAGSPRFDAYVKNKKPRVASDSTGITIVSNTPTISVGERYGTYSVEEYFHTLGEVARGVPDVRLLIASRSASVRSAFFEEARERGLAGIPYESVGTTPLPELFRQADIFVCSHSTVVYEALLYRLPVVIASFAPVEKMMTDFHFRPFEEAGAVAIAHTPEQLREIVGKLAADAEARERMSAAGEAFMKEQFSFDGYSSKRIADRIRAWASSRGSIANGAACPQ